MPKLLSYLPPSSRWSPWFGEKALWEQHKIRNSHRSEGDQFQRRFRWALEVAVAWTCLRTGSRSPSWLRTRTWSRPVRRIKIYAFWIINDYEISLLIKFTTNKQQDSIIGYFYTGVLFFSLIVENLIGQHYYHRMLIVG